LSLLNKNTQKYFPSLDASSSDWERDPFVFSVFKPAELTAVGDEEVTKKKQ
jgi:hypothetical protein